MWSSKKLVYNSPLQYGIRTWFCHIQSQLAGASQAMSFRPASPHQNPCSSLAWSAWAPPQPPRRAITGTANGAFQTPAVSLASLLPSLHVPLSFPESLPAAQLLESVKITFGMFSSCLKGLIALFFPQSQQNIENGLHGKRERWFLCKLKVMSAKLICSINVYK